MILFSMTISFLVAGELVITRDGETAQTQDVSNWTPGEEFLLLEGEPYSNYYYPWTGEDSIDYKVDEQGLWVSGKLVGFNTFDQEPKKVKNPKDVVTILATVEYLPDLGRFPNLAALSVVPTDEDNDLSTLRKLKGLRYLNLGEGPIAEDGVDALAELTDLRELDASFTILPEGAMESIGKLPNLKKLSLNAVSGEEILCLKGMKNLEALSTMYTMADTPWLELLPTLTGLKELSVIQSEIVPEVLKLLAGTNQLERLYLPYAGVEDTHLAYIGKMTNLEELDIYGTRITESGLKYLNKLMNLKTLYLGGGAELSSDAVARLQKKLPGCEIRADE
jgi:Leucine-rich repeat (LRR) protein